MLCQYSRDDGVFNGAVSTGKVNGEKKERLWPSRSPDLNPLTFYNILGVQLFDSMHFHRNIWFSATRIQSIWLNMLNKFVVHDASGIFLLTVPFDS